jgi:hypothetical protein
MAAYVGKILMISESPFPGDPRVEKEAYTLTKFGIHFKILGEKYFFNHYDLAPELCLSKYNIKEEGVFYRVLLIEEILWQD